MLLSLFLFLFLLVSQPSAESGSVNLNQESNSQSRSQYRQELTQQIKADVAERQASKSAVRTEKIDQICARTEERINQRLTRYEQNRDQWMTRHQGIVKRLESLAGKLEARGCDPTQLRAEIQTYNQLIENFAAAFRDFHTTLQGTRQYTCGESEGQFAGQVKDSTVKLQAVHQAANALHQHVKTALQTRLQAVNQSCQEAQ